MILMICMVIGAEIQMLRRIKVERPSQNGGSFSKENFIGGAKDFSDKKCAVIIDKCKKEIGGYSIVFTIQRGFIRFTIDTVTTVLARNNVALINYQEITERINDTMNTLYQRIVDTYTRWGLFAITH